MPARIVLLQPLMSDVARKKGDIQKKIIEWGVQNYREFPWRENRTPFSVLVAESLLRRTTATAVKRVFEEFLSMYPSIMELSKASPFELETSLARIGYHRQRAKMLIETSRHLMTEFRGKVPKTREDLLGIPHIGEYTANAVLSFGYGIAAAIVDSNIKRILERIFLNHFRMRPNYVLIQKVADAILPIGDHQTFNYALLDFGSAICKYGIPKCRLCPLNGLCDYCSAKKHRVR
jgi:A/G-specific adenine glycosylase